MHVVYTEHVVSTDPSAAKAKFKKIDVALAGDVPGTQKIMMKWVPAATMVKQEGGSGLKAAGSGAAPLNITNKNEEKKQMPRPAIQPPQK